MRGQHARHHKFIIVNEGDHHETGGKILCGWMDCERPGYSLYVLRIDYGSPGQPHFVRYAFCSQRHLEYFRHSHRQMGQLPPGLRNLTLPR